MYMGLGNNVATSILASVATIFCITPVLFLKFGATLRRMSDMACSDEEALQEENAHLIDKDEDKAEKRQVYTSRSIPRFGVV
jgi:hypothetical protein